MKPSHFLLSARGLALLLGATLTTGATPPSPAPNLVLWVWERPEDLRFIDPARYGIALLVGTIHLEAEGVQPERRRQPASWPATTEVTAVVRIEATPNAVLSMATIAPTTRAIESWARSLEPVAVQIDFDARRSERTFYRTLLTELRGRLPASTRLEITALASWCLGDPWFADLPIDDAIPMLFRLGADHAAVHRHLAAGGDFGPMDCRRSLGFSLDEPVAHTLTGRRTLLFNPEPWTAAALDPIPPAGDRR